jgi:hypothetical protein
MKGGCLPAWPSLRINLEAGWGLGTSRLRRRSGRGLNCDLSSQYTSLGPWRLVLIKETTLAQQHELSPGRTLAEIKKASLPYSPLNAASPCRRPSVHEHCGMFSTTSGSSFSLRSPLSLSGSRPPQVGVCQWAHKLIQACATNPTEVDFNLKGLGPPEAKFLDGT